MISYRPCPESPIEYDGLIVGTMSAVRNIIDSYRFQWTLGGGLGARLGYLTRYWAAYLYHRWAAGSDWYQAHGRAIRHLAEAGLTRRVVVTRLPQGLRFESDLLTATMILKEILGDGMYKVQDDPGFEPREGATVIDVGAQQGVFAVLAAAGVGPRGRLIAVEPEPVNFSRLEANLARNGLRQAAAVNLALSDARGKATLRRDAVNTGGHTLLDGPGDGGMVEVDVDTLDGLVERLGIPALDLLKVDVEGSALAVLRGGLKTLARSRPRIVMELDQPDDVGAVERLLGPLRYRVFTRDNVLFARPA